VVVAGVLSVRMITVTVDRRLRHQLMRLLMVVDSVRVEMMRSRTDRLMLMLELRRLWNVVGWRKIGRLVVDRGRYHGRIIVDPDSCCICHGYVIR